MSALLTNPRAIFLTLGSVVWLSLVCAGQTLNPNDVSGVVKDTSGAAIPLGAVSLLDARQFVVAKTQTDNQGRFTLSGMSPGSYELLVSYRGFAPRRMAISIPSAGAQKLDVVLGIAALEEKITVTADLGLV